MVLYAQTRDRDAAGIAAGVFEADIDAWPVRAEGESLRPFDDDDGSLSECILESERLKVLKGLDAIEVHVIDLARVRALLGARKTVVVEDMNECECGAGDVLFASGSHA